MISEFEFLNAWQDKETIKRFRSQDSLNKYLNKHYPKVDIDFEGTCIN